MALIVTFTNDGTGENGFGNYNVMVMANNKVLYGGQFNGHLRSLGWRTLVKGWANMIELPRTVGGDVDAG